MQKETPWFPNISEFTRINPFLFHLSNYGYFPPRAQRLGASSPARSVAQRHSHRVTVPGLGSCQPEVWPQGDQRWDTHGDALQSQPLSQSAVPGVLQTLVGTAPRNQAPAIILLPLSDPSPSPSPTASSNVVKAKTNRGKSEV